MIEFLIGIIIDAIALLAMLTYHLIVLAAALGIIYLIVSICN